MRIDLFKSAYIYYLLAVALIGAIFFVAILGDSVLPAMDVTGWIFFVTSCLSHASILVLILLLIFFMPWSLLKMGRLATVLFVGNELRYAFIVEGDTILTKEGAGWINVTDAQMNPVKDYRLKPKDFDAAMRRLNSFFKQ